jgi:uncharacterized protein
MPLIPRDEKYFDQLNDLVTNIHKGADLLVRLFDDVPNKTSYLKQIKDVEHECDRISKGIVERLNSTFVTPIDREDIYLLATELDDVMDRINDIALMSVLYGIRAARPDAKELANILMRVVLEMEPAVRTLQSGKGVRVHIERIKQIEEEGDRAWQAAVQQLFEHETDAIELVRWKDIYDKLEAGIDRCNDVAKGLEGIIVKHA